MDAKKMMLMMDQAQYWQKTINIVGQSNIVGYYPSTELTGTVCKDYSGNGYDGTYTSVELANSLGVHGRMIPRFNGSSSKLSLYSAGFASKFDPLEGAIFIDCSWEDFSDTTRRDLMFFQSGTDGNSFVQLLKDASANVFKFNVKHGGTDCIVTTDKWQGTTGIMSFCLSWSKSNNRARLYCNGSLVEEKSGLGTWSGAINKFWIGSTTGSSNWWKGLVENILILKAEPTASQVYSLSKITTKPIKRFTILGDSISSENPTSWVTTVVNTYNLGRCHRHNNATGGHSIVANMDAQVTASASDNSDIIIVALGSNDNDAGDMVALQDEYEENIAELKASNPSATIYAINAWKGWTATDGATERIHTNVRAATLAACTAQGVTVFDPYTTPWFAANETSDGVHPTAAGHAKIAAEVLTRI